MTPSLIAQLVQTHGITLEQFRRMLRASPTRWIESNPKVRFDSRMRERIAKALGVDEDVLFHARGFARPSLADPKDLPKVRFSLPPEPWLTEVEWLRKEKGQSATQTAHGAKICRTAFSDMERYGQRPRPDARRCIAAFLGVSQSALFDTEGFPLLHVSTEPFADRRVTPPASPAPVEPPRETDLGMAVRHAIHDLRDAVLLVATELSLLRGESPKPPAAGDTPPKPAFTPIPAETVPLVLPPPSPERPGALRAPNARFAVLGLLPVQALDIERTFPGEVVAVPKDRIKNNGSMPRSLAGFERVYVMTRFVGHAWTTNLKTVMPDQRQVRLIPGAVSDLKRTIAEDLRRTT